MEFGTRFLPLAGNVGLISNLTFYVLVFSSYALLGSFVFSLATRTQVAPEHRSSCILTALIGLIAGISYFLIQDYYRDALRVVAQTPDPAARLDIIHDTYFAIGQLRYMDWLFTTPLLLLKMPLMLKAKPHEMWRPLTLMLLADMFMVVTGYIGQQQLDAEANVLQGPHLLWGAISTIGYLVIPFVLYRLYQQFKARSLEYERRAYRYMALTTVTFWGVYPIGFILEAALPGMNFNWLHIVFSIADIINKVGVGAIVYLAGARALRDRIDIESKEYAIHVG